MKRVETVSGALFLHTPPPYDIYLKLVEWVEEEGVVVVSHPSVSQELLALSQNRGRWTSPGETVES